MGYADDPICRICGELPGTAVHCLHGECAAMNSDLVWRSASGKSKFLPRAAADPALRPLAEMCLPPVVTKWEPVPPQPVEGDCPTVECARLYGDGSGYNQRHKRLCQASWSVVRMADSRDASEDDCQPAAAMRARVPGWYRTVPRGELYAVAHALERVGLRMVYVGDCRLVIDGCRQGVAQSLRSSGNANADIWRRIGQLLDDRGAHVEFVKVKAHRSSTAAAGEGALGMLDWSGNRAADSHCKSLIKHEATMDPRVNEQLRAARLYVAVAEYLGFTAGWAMQRQPAAFSRKNKYVRVAVTGPAAEAMVGQHATIPRKDGGRVCTICRLSCRSEKGLVALRRRPCRGSFAQQTHQSHSMSISCGVSFCVRCGAYASLKMRTLRAECPGRPRTTTQASIKRRLVHGLPPTAAAVHIDIARDAEDEAAVSSVKFGCAGDAVCLSGSGTEGTAVGSSVSPVVIGPSYYRQLEIRRRSRAPAPAVAGASVPPPRGGSDARPSRSLVVRRRFSGKRPDPAADHRLTAHGRQILQLCAPVSARGWAGRLRARLTLGGGEACTRCARACITACRGCDQPLCRACAVDGVWCAFKGAHRRVQWNPHLP
jgi:hypothetical protein